MVPAERNLYFRKNTKFRRRSMHQFSQHEFFTKTLRLMPTHWPELMRNLLVAARFQSASVLRVCE